MSRKRRGNREGSIYYREDKRLWVAVVSLGYDQSGRRIRRKVYGATKGEALEKLRALQVDVGAGVDVRPSERTVADLLAQWLDAVRADLSPNTVASYEITARVHLVPRLGRVRLEHLTPAHVSALYRELAQAGASGRTRENVHLVLSRALKQALRWGYVSRVVTEAVDRPRRERVEIETWSAEQAGAFLAACRNDRLWAMYVLAITTGLRQGELFGLVPADVDLERGTLSVARALREVRGVISESAPKTRAGLRMMALPAIAIEAIRSHLEWRAAEGLAEARYLFCDSDGGPLRKSNVRRRSFDRLVRAAAVPRISFHSLRHTCATILLAENVHPRVVQERLGHADIGTTLRTYSHVLPSMQSEASAKIDAALRRPRKR